MSPGSAALIAAWRSPPCATVMVLPVDVGVRSIVSADGGAVGGVVGGAGGGARRPDRLDNAQRCDVETARIEQERQRLRTGRERGRPRQVLPGLPATGRRHRKRRGHDVPNLHAHPARCIRRGDPGGDGVASGGRDVDAVVDPLAVVDPPDVRRAQAAALEVDVRAARDTAGVAAGRVVISEPFSAVVEGLESNGPGQRQLPCRCRARTTAGATRTQFRLPNADTPGASKTTLATCGPAPSVTTFEIVVHVCQPPVAGIVSAPVTLIPPNSTWNVPPGVGAATRASMR